MGYRQALLALVAVLAGLTLAGQARADATVTTPQQAIAWTVGSATPATQDFTIAGDATACYLFWTYYANSTGHGLASATLESVSPSQTFELPGTTSLTATGVVAWYNPGTGAGRTLDVDWDVAPAEGPTSSFICTTGGDTTAWRDADADADTATNAVSVTLTTVAGDLVLKFDQFYNNLTYTNVPALSAGWTSSTTFGQSPYVESARLSYIVASGSTQVADSENEDYSTIVAISIPAASVGGGSAVPVIIQQH